MKERNQTDASPKNLTERTFSGFSWTIFGGGAQVVLKIGVLAVLARLVSPKEFGLMGIATIVVEFSKMFSHMGIGPAIVQREKLEDRHLITGFTLSLFMGIFFGGILFLIAPILAIFFRMPELTNVLRVISLVFLVDSLTLIAQALMQRNMKFKVSTAIEITSYLLGYGFIGILLAYKGLGVWALVIANLAQAALFSLLMVLFQSFPKKLGFEINAFKELFFFGSGMTLAKIGNYLATQGDNIVVGRMLGSVALGIYGRAYQFMVMPASLFGNALDKALFPAMSKVQNDKKRLAKAYLTGVSMIGIVSIPISLMIIFLAHEIVLILLGSAWIEVVLPLQILSCSLLFRMSYKMSDSLSRATGAVFHRAWRQLIYASLVFTGSYIGQFWGLYGVAIGVALALIVNFLMMAQLSLRITGITWAEMIKAHQYGIVSGIITAIGTYATVTLCRLNELPDFLTLAISLAGSSIPLLIVLNYFPNLVLSNELENLIEVTILKRFKKRL